MTTAQYNSNNSLTPEIKWTSFEKRNNLDELINMPIKAKERFVIQMSFWTQDPSIRQAHPESASKITADPRSAVFSKSANPLDLQHKSTIRAHFKANPSIRKPIHPPPIVTGLAEACRSCLNCASFNFSFFHFSFFSFSSFDFSSSVSVSSISALQFQFFNFSSFNFSFFNISSSISVSKICFWLSLHCFWCLVCASLDFWSHLMY